MSEIQMLREIVDKFLEAHGCDDLWIDGVCGAAFLSQAKELADQWKEKYPTAPLHCGKSTCSVCNSQFI